MQDGSAPRQSDAIVFALLSGMAVVLGAFLRLRGLATQPLFGDEHHTLGELARSYGEVFASFGVWGSHASLPLLQKACIDVVGPGVVGFRLPAAVPGILVLLVVYPVARGFVGRTSALVATWAVAVSPMLVYYGHFARSYSLAVLLALGLAHAARRAVETGEPGRWSAWLGAGACAALLPWVHLSTVGFVAGTGLATCVLAFRRGGTARGAALATFGGAALACALLYAPAWEAVRAYVEKVSGEVGTAGDVTFLEVTTLLFGNRLVGALGVPALVVTTAVYARRERSAGAIVVGGLVGLVAGFFASRPYGLAYAYARYFVVVLPFVWMVIAYGLVALAGRLLPGNADAPATGEPVARTAGLVLVLALFLTGPLAPTRPTTGTFDNSYLAMRALPAFDAPFGAMPDAYRDFEGDVIVAPALTTRSVLLYRNYALQHGKRVWTGTFGAVPAPLREPPYVPLFEGEAVRATGARRLILHRDAAGEAASYWDFVYGEAWPALGGSDEHPDAGLMRRQQKYAPPPPFPPALEAGLRERYGPPVVETERVLAWDL